MHVLRFVPSRPFGTNHCSSLFPNVETLGYYHSSLRDEDSIRESLKEIFGLFKKSLAERAFFAVTELGEFLELGFLVSGKMRWHFDVDAHVQIALPIALNIFNAFPLEPKHRGRLRARGNFYGRLTFQRRYFNVRAERSLDEIYRHLAKQIVAVALEYRVRFDVQHDI